MQQNKVPSWEVVCRKQDLMWTSVTGITWTPGEIYYCTASVSVLDTYIFTSQSASQWGGEERRRGEVEKTRGRRRQGHGVKIRERGEETRRVGGGEKEERREGCSPWCRTCSSLGSRCLLWSGCWWPSAGSLWWHWSTWGPIRTEETEYEGVL